MAGVPDDHHVVHFGPGSEIGPYRLEHELGQGGMAHVFKARDVTLDRPVAIKLMHPHLHRVAGFKERFLREARAVARINHPNVIAIHQAGETHGGQLYMALEFVDGRDLASVVEDDGPLPRDRAIDIITQCCQGLQALHQAGLVHRDIKPPNIFLTHDGVAKLGDLGLARAEDQDDNLTASGAMLGTPAYMSPEQVRATGEIDIRSDIHALGATLYSLLTGCRPFPAAALVACYYQIANDPPPRLADNGGPDDARLQAVIDTAMAKDPADRFRDPMALLAALDGSGINDLGTAPTLVPSSAAPLDETSDPALIPTRKMASTPAPAAAAPATAAATTKARGLPSPVLLASGAIGLLVLAMVILAIADDGTPAPAAAPINPITRLGQSLQQAADSATADELWRDGQAALLRGSDADGRPWLDLLLPNAAGQTVRQRFRLVPAGTYTVGSPDDETGRSHNEFRHEVELSTPRWIADQECSRSFLAAIREADLPDDGDLPVTGITWHEAKQAADLLDRRLGDHAHADLPGEIEWEIACRAGSDGPFSFVDGDLAAYGNVADASSGLEWAADALDDGHAELAPVGSFAPNAWGFYDMHGNAWEWCSDFYVTKRTSIFNLNDQLRNPDANRVRRGGSWNEAPRYARSASRIGSHPNDTDNAVIGFRLMLTLPSDEAVDGP